ncbi:2-succinyl-6-hydroxy-2,4-cyclohexadiene-1-carboxylate synthase [Frondihabitans sp. 762G35]|uniref:dienelactone hydrolase family protein n=1 Tax=Frondihabitans sp. 762G35 TaxID=1446794 RepID=UPI000D200D24|nr:dienelactone hydrolase family protein [Frondihabitans sp. 762G35]ARC58342.1 2-succinyl-6-hydroxy-2,4-cyclohexadiene-1-carboxylate synthase [Frondihabitans sp. 762G35]
MNAQKHRRPLFWLVLSLVLMLVSSIGASIVQTSGGAVKIRDMSWVTGSGKTMSALLLVPDGASATDKRPAIVLAHGWWNNKEMQDSNYVELARRGYVVLSIDMYGHASSDPLQEGHEMDAATGMYDGVKEIASLPFVDTAKIGISGHSNGARAANFAIPIDDQAATPLIRSVYLVDNDPIYTDTAGKYVDYYGNRDVGVQADQYDEFFFRSYDKDGAELTPPREYIGTPNAQSFLHFGADPQGTSMRKPYTTYTQEVDGRKVMREIDNPAQTHPWGPFSKQEVTSVVTFFDKSLGAPNPIPAGSQIWQFKEGFNALGLVGFGIFLVAFATALLETRAFAGLRSAPKVVPPLRGRDGLLWFWGGLVVSAIISGVSYWIISANTAVGTVSFLGDPPVNPQGAVWIIGLWAALNGVVSIVIMVVSYRLFGRRNGMDLREAGVLPGWRKFGQGILLGLIVVVSAFLIVFVLAYFFTTDFRLWVLAVPTFTPNKLAIALIYLPFFLVYFFANSVAINAFNRFTIRGREWGNTAVLALANGIAPIILVIAQYSHFFVTGDLIPGFGGINSIWLFPVVVILPVAAVVTRKIYRQTGNPYIGGFIMATVVTVVSVSNTLTYTR